MTHQLVRLAARNADRPRVPIQLSLLKHQARDYSEVVAGKSVGHVEAPERNEVDVCLGIDTTTFRSKLIVRHFVDEPRGMAIR